VSLLTKQDFYYDCPLKSLRFQTFAKPPIIDKRTI
jgi:hypothetical protein